MSNTTVNLFETLGHILKPDTALLSHLEDKAKAAHRNISFSPERRGEQMIAEYSKELASDISELHTGGASEESITDYKARYERSFSSYLHAKSNTFSVMITGGSNFPVRRHAKANRSEERHYEIFREWRVRAKKAIVRRAQPVKTFASELDRYQSELAILKYHHNKKKEGNKYIARARKEGFDISQHLIDEFYVKPHMIPDVMKFGFHLQNDTANIKRIEGMIKIIEQKETLKETSPITTYSFVGGKFVVNYEVDRIQVFFDVKPTQDELNTWKVKGLNTFNWSPTAAAWQRKITPNAFSCVKRMFEIITKL